MQIHIQDVPEEVIDKYNVIENVDKDGYIYCKTSGDMYGLA